LQNINGFPCYYCKGWMIKGRAGNPISGQSVAARAAIHHRHQPLGLWPEHRDGLRDT